MRQNNNKRDSGCTVEGDEACFVVQGASAFTESGNENESSGCKMNKS